MKRTKFGQVWLARLSYFPGNPPFEAVIKIQKPGRDGVLFRNLESEEAWTVLDSRDMHLFTLLGKVKD